MFRRVTADAAKERLERELPNVQVEVVPVGVFFSLHIYPHRAGLVERYTVFSEPSLRELEGRLREQRSAP